MKIFKKSLLAPWLAASLAIPMQAQAAIEDNITISGFASFVGGRFSEDTHQFAGYDDEVTFSADSIMGLQLSAQLSDKISVTTQLVAKGIDDYDVEAELAYLTYSVNRNWDIRAGRIRAPFFYYSDFLDVGYAYPWIRPPSDIYRILLLSFDGVDTLYRMNHGDWSSTWQFFYGNEDEDIESVLIGETIPTEANAFTGINVTLSNDWLTLRGGFVSTDITQGLPSALENFYDNVLTPAGFGDVVAEWDIREEKNAEYLAFAAIIDYNDWLFTAEYTQVEWDRPNIILNDEAWFVMAGRRFGDFTVHLTYAQREDDPEFEANTIPEAHPLHGVFDGIISNAGNSEDTTITAGVRYDIEAGVALKFEVSRNERDIAEPLFPGHDSPLDDGTLINFGVDLVF